MVILDQITKEIDKRLKNERLIVAIDGGSASGKTTLASMLSEKYDCTVFHMDDFFLQTHQRTSERLSLVGGNIDYERFLDEVLIPLSKNENVCYRKFDCSTMTLGDIIMAQLKPLVIIEGTYSMHIELAKYYNLSIFLDINSEFQRKRIMQRNSLNFANRFFNEWIPLENIYFNQTDIKKRCDIIVLVSDN